MTQEELVERTLNDERVLEDWGIAQARRLSRITYLVFLAVTVATVIGAAAYLAFTDESLVKLNTTGYWLVVLFALVLFGLRFVQLRMQRNDVTAFIPLLSRKLTGEPEHDAQAQADTEMSYQWKSRTIMIVIRMIAAAMVVLIAVNTYQGGVMDLGRQLVFDGCIATVIAGFAWDQFTFRAELLESELRARTAAAARYQTTPEYQEQMRRQREEEEALIAEQEAIAAAIAERQRTDALEAPSTDEQETE